MAMRVGTMTSLGSMNSPVAVRDSNRAGRKLVLLLLLITAAALWISILFKDQAGFPLLLSTFFADASLGMVAGFGCRVVLRSRIVSIFFGMILATFGMTLLGNITQWVLGIGPIKLTSEAAEQLNRLRFDITLFEQIRSLQIDPLALFDFRNMDWADPAHLGVSLTMTVLSLFAWYRAASPASQQIVEVMPLAAQAAPQTLSPSPRGRTRVRPPVGLVSPLGQSPRSRRGVRSTVLREAKSGNSETSRRKRSRRKAHIQFALVEEHRCPYCLDAVTHNDARGVQECEVCHTLHHADCWAISGVCQVPHLNT